MSRVIRIALLLALTSAPIRSQDTSKVAKDLEKTLGELDEELRHIQRVLQEISRFSKADGGSANSNDPTKSIADIALAQEAYQQGRVAEERRQYETAVDAFTRAIQLFPTSEVNYFRRGRVYFELGLLDLALRDLNQSLQLQPDNSRALELRARIHRGLKSYDLAIADLQAAALRDADNPDYVLTQGAIAEERGDTQAALDLYLQAARIRPQWAEVNLRRAGALRKAKRFGEAVSECSAAIELDRSSAAGYICRADSLVHMGQVEMAVSDLDQAMRLDPMALDAGPVISAVWRDLQVRGAKQLAAATPATVPTMPPPVPSPTKAAVVASAPAVVPAKPALVEAAAVSPDPPAQKPLPPVAGPDQGRQAKVYTQKGREALEQGRYQAALDELTKAIELDPSSAVAYNSRGYTYLRTRDYGQAIADFTAAIGINTNYANAYVNRGAARRLAGDMDGAREDFRIAAKLSATAKVDQEASRSK